MKSKILLTSIAALSLTATANAAEYQPFVGLSLGMQSAKYSRAAEDYVSSITSDLPSDFFNIGIEGGFRFGEYDEIYNGGMTVALDFTTNSSIENRFTNVKAANINVAHLSALYDNYLRLSGDKEKRIDLVLGVGLGVMNYHINAKDPLLFHGETIYSGTVAFKAGLDFELTKSVTLSTNVRVFTPVRSHYAADVTYIAGGAIKYKF